MVIWIFMQTFIVSVEGNADFEYDGIMPTGTSPCSEKNDSMSQSVIITRTRLQSCDHVTALYTLSPSIKNKTFNRVQSCER